MLPGVRQGLSDALNGTCCVIVCVTKRYESKVNSRDEGDYCWYEFNIGATNGELVNNRIVVSMEEGMVDARRWEAGRLKDELGHKLCFDMSSDEEVKFEGCCNELAEEVVRLLRLRYPQLL